jgi:ABC-type spermidine/putrescine transport system permease subunit I
MKRMALGLLATAFVVGGAFVLSGIIIRIIRVLFVGKSTAPTFLDTHQIPLAAAIALIAGIATLWAWFVVTDDKRRD